MTGFGRGIAHQGAMRATVDVRAVNHRFLDLKLRGTPLGPAVEEAVTARVRTAIERGAVTVAVHVERDGAPAQMTIDRAAADAAFASLSALASRLGLPGPDLALVLAQPGVVVSATSAEEDPPVLAALDPALAQLVDMRQVEGRALASELAQRLDDIATLRSQVATIAADVPRQLTQRLTTRLERLLDGHDAQAIDPLRLAQEVALLADRSDVTEELVRLSSHLEQARTLIGGTGAVGRRLDFLVQEIGRELNTIGSKSTVADITTAVVSAKAALEKVREQVQNVE